MNQIMLVLLLLPFLPCVSESQQFEYVSAVIGSFQRCKIAQERFGIDSTDDFVPMMKKLIVYSRELEQANSLIRGYTTSKNTVIQQSANAFSTIYTGVSKKSMDFVGFIEETMNDPEATISRRGTWSRTLSEHMAILEQLWGTLPYATIAMTYSLIDTTSKVNDKLGYLLLTESQVLTLKNQLIQVFGKKVKSGMKAGELPLETCGAMLYEFLAKWKPKVSR